MQIGGKVIVLFIETSLKVVYKQKIFEQCHKVGRKSFRMINMKKAFDLAVKCIYHVVSVKSGSIVPIFFRLLGAKI